MKGFGRSGNRRTVYVAGVLMFSVAGMLYTIKPEALFDRSSNKTVGTLAATQSAQNTDPLNNSAQMVQSLSNNVSSEEPTSTSQTSPSQHKPTNPEHAATPEATTTCMISLPDLIKSYQVELAKDRRLLDQRLTFPPVGSIIGMTYIDDYNAAAKRIFDRFTESARVAQCDFPFKEPSYLPSNYPL